MNQFDRMMEKLEDVNCKIGNLRVDVAGIKQHLKDMNGSVGRHENQIQELETNHNKDYRKLDDKIQDIPKTGQVRTTKDNLYQLGMNTGGTSVVLLLIYIVAKLLGVPIP